MNKKGYQRLSDEGSYVASESSSLTAQVQNVKGKKVYVFGDGTIASDNEDADDMELTHMTQRGQHKTYRSTNSHQQYDDVLVKEIPLHRDDTLQSLSIKFRCPVSFYLNLQLVLFKVSCSFSCYLCIYHCRFLKSNESMESSQTRSFMPAGY